MSRLPRFGSALSALALASVLTGCAGLMSRPGAQAAKLDKSDIGLATKAHMALAAGDFDSAISFAERAVENEPRDPALRALLGNTYFGSGRFASAESAYRDSISLAARQPKVVLKLVLVQIAQGKNADALSLLAQAQSIIEPADYGLALALAGQPNEAVMVLEPAARARAADARVRQNLAFAYGLSGDWLSARTVAAQDLPPDQVDSRIHHWMALSTPMRPSDQVAALVGVNPAMADPGQPVRLALTDGGTRLAQQEVAPAPAPIVEQAPVAGAAVTAFAPMQPAEEPAQAVAEYQAPPVAAAFEAPAAEQVVAAASAAPAVAEQAPPPLVAALAPKVPQQEPPAEAASREGKSGFVVQLGAYSAEDRVESAWEQIADRYGAVRDYTPTSARFSSSKGTVFRLSVKGFDSYAEANKLCSSLKRQGKACFVRNIAGDSPVQFASR